MPMIRLLAEDMKTPLMVLAARNVRVLIAAKTAEHDRPPTDEEVERWAAVYEHTAFLLRRVVVERSGAPALSLATTPVPEAKRRTRRRQAATADAEVLPEAAPEPSSPALAEQSATVATTVEEPTCSKCGEVGHRWGFRCPKNAKYKPPPTAPAAAAPAPTQPLDIFEDLRDRLDVFTGGALTSPPPAAPAALPADTEPEPRRAPKAAESDPVVGPLADSVPAPKGAPAVLASMLAALRRVPNPRMSTLAKRIEAQASETPPQTEEDVRTIGRAVAGQMNISMYGLREALKSHFLAPGEVAVKPEPSPPPTRMTTPRPEKKAVVPAKPAKPDVPVSIEEVAGVRRRHQPTPPNVPLGGNAVASATTRAASQDFMSKLIDPTSGLMKPTLPPRPPQRPFFGD